MKSLTRTIFATLTVVCALLSHAHAVSDEATMPLEHAETLYLLYSKVEQHRANLA